MKVVIAISHSFCANFIRGQAEFLRSKGHTVILVSADGPEVRQVAEKENSRLVIIPFKREISIISDFLNFFRVLKFLRKEKPDIVNAGNPKTGFLFMLASVFFPKIPMIFTLRGLRSDTLNGLKKRIVFLTEWISCNLADKVISISPSLREHAIREGVLKEKKAVVIGKGSSNGVNIEKFHPNEADRLRGQELRNKLGISESDIVFGHVGRITKDKGIEELYRAFLECQRNNSNIKLILTGPIEPDDPINSDIFHEIESNKDVFLIGKQMDVTAVYSSYDVLILYSYREGFGNVALEASAMGVPTIVSDIPGARDTTEHMKSGILVKPRNSKLLGIAMQMYIDNPELGKEHGHYGVIRAREGFASEVIWNGQLELYNQLLGK